MTANKIFISHSSKDISIVISFVENILMLGMEIPSERIFCSSLEGNGVKSGQYIPDRLKEEINLASIALLLVSKNYKNSEICLNEVGAAWAVLPKESVIPVLLPGVDFKDLGFLDLNRFSIKLFEKSGILRLIQDCKAQLNPDYDLTKVTAKIDVFLDAMQFPSENTPALSEEELKEVSDWNDCFINNLYPFDNI